MRTVGRSQKIKTIQSTRFMNMKKQIRILHLEDNPADAEIVSFALKAGPVNFQIELVNTEQAFVSALDQNGFDLILADYSMPGFDGMSALDMAREKHPETPYILISGSVGEEIAVDCLKRGAMDYILKDRISRLVPAVQRALRETNERGERRKLEEQVIQSQRMEAVGQLAAGIAHDFNNVLSVMIGFSELLSLDAPNETHRGYADTIRLAAERASSLTRQLLIFSRKQAPQASILNLNEVIRDAEKMLPRLVEENIEVSIFPGRDIYPVKADAGHLWQLLMNLVVNARDAMPNGGRLKIATRNASVTTLAVAVLSRRLCRHQCDGHRHRHDGGGKVPFVRGLFHNEAGWQGNRARSGDVPNHRQAVRRAL